MNGDRELGRLIEDLREQLFLIQQVTDAAHSRYAKNASMALVECQWAFAAGQCRAIAERMLAMLRDAKAKAAQP